MKYRIILLAAALGLLLGGCSLLERDYRTLEPHSSTYREETDENALRASNYQDLVNAILLMAEERRETSRLHLYEEEIVSAWTMLRRAREDILQQTPAGAYALSNITWKTSSQRDYCAVDLTLTYRRTQAEEEAIIDASSSNAVYDLIPFALEEKRQCLAVRFTRLDQSPEELTEGILALQIERLREELGLPDGETPENGDSQSPEGETPPEDGDATAAPPEGQPEGDGETTEPGEEETSPEEEPIVPENPWEVVLYPNNENAGIVEIFFW